RRGRRRASEGRGVRAQVVRALPVGGRLRHQRPGVAHGASAVPGRTLAPHPSLQPHRADLRRDSSADQGDRPAPRRSIVSVTRLGGPGSRQPRLAGAHHAPQTPPPPAGPPPTAAPSPRRRGGDQPDRHGRRVISPRSLRPKPFYTTPGTPPPDEA